MLFADILPLLNSLIGIIVTPAVGILIWVFKSHVEKTAKLEARVHELEKHSAVIAVKLDIIDEKLSDIKRVLERRQGKR